MLRVYSRSKLALIIGIFLMPLAAKAVELPPLVCREQQVVVVRPDTLATHIFHSSSLYRFASKGLYLSDKDRAEYFYNEMKMK